MPLITLTNDFHQTTTRVRCTSWGDLSAAQVRQVRLDLCGAHDCPCGDALGTRGMAGWMITECPDGSVQVLPPWPLKARADAD